MNDANLSHFARTNLFPETTDILKENNGSILGVCLQMQNPSIQIWFLIADCFKLRLSQLFYKLFFSKWLRQRTFLLCSNEQIKSLCQHGKV